jgi:hypothetical protein
MSIRDVLEKRRRIIVAVSVGAFLALFLGVLVSVTLHRPWLAYLGAFVFLAAAYLNTAWLRCPRCRRSIGFARERPRKVLPPFGPGDSCPYCGVSLEEPWDKMP